MSIAAVGLWLPALLAAQQAPPGCTAPEYRQFDFWVGEWSVTDSSGTKPYGTNVITTEEAGCLVRERWTAAGGGTGQSMNFYDRQRGRWEQLWVARGGSILRLSGGLEGTRMVLEGETRTAAGATVLNRIAWSPEPDGRVRQLWTTSTDGGKTWKAGFDGWYRRR
jgi:hypothetical protein